MNHSQLNNMKSNHVTDHRWLSIPEGTVTLSSGGYLAETTQFRLPSFELAKYPVTNQQYARFIAAGGYDKPDWWQPAGWQLRQKQQWQEPRHWYGRDWTAPAAPVVGVSWYEADAYCCWLSQSSGQTITLPSEQQWQRAAQGNDGRHYPWGNEEPQSHHCNWNRLVDETTAVDHYTAGASPFAVMDMCGNVWEWCATAWAPETMVANGRELRLVRGGSWSSDSPLSLRVTNRSPRDPNTRLPAGERNLVTVGFRCLRHL